MADSLAVIRKCVYPYPVYEAHFSDNTVARLSFWSRAGKPLDVDRGRRLVGLIYSGKTAVDGFVEHDPADMAKPWYRARDPLYSGDPAPVTRKRGATAKQCRTVIERLLADYSPAAIADARALLDGPRL